MHNQLREPQPYEDFQAKSIQEFGWTSQWMIEAGVKVSRATTHRRVNEFGYICRQRRLTWAKVQVAWSPVLHFHSLWWSGVQYHLLVLVHCVFLKTNVTAPVYQAILEHFILPSTDQHFKDADFIFQQDLAPAHTAKSTKCWLNDLDWQANSPDLNPKDNLWGIVKSKIGNKRPKKCKECQMKCQRNLGFHTTSAVPQTDHLHATPNWSSN